MVSAGIVSLKVCLQQFSRGDVGPEAAYEVGYIGGWLPWATKDVLAAVGGHLTVAGPEKPTPGATGCQVDV